MKISGFNGRCSYMYWKHGGFKLREIDKSCTQSDKLEII